jgi:UDP-glucose 4-epimerase
LYQESTIFHTWVLQNDCVFDTIRAMKILVTGGAGYIGSFMTKRLLDEGYDVVVLDSLERGHKEAVDERASLVIGNLLDKSFLATVFANHQFDGIIHFAGYIAVGESMEHPASYFENNTLATLNLLDEACKHKVNKIIFSSTAAVYGDPLKMPIPENHPKHPTSVYGESKLMVERILQWYQQIYGMNFVALRYFNACGAALDGSMGEAHEPETHIIPRAIQALLTDTPFTFFGTDYRTSDGTCVRDYIHVLDLVEAHILALAHLKEKTGGFLYNVGTGKGYSNKEVLDMVQEVSGKIIAIKQAARRSGDPDELVADVSRIKTELGFTPKHSQLKTIISSALAWHRKQ